MDGTKCTVVTDSRAMTSTISCGSRCACASAATRVAPVMNAHSSSHTDTSKVYGVFCSTTSPGPMRYSSCIHPSRLASDRCVICTPLGAPVEPEVKMT
jgi:hypothetical protein